MNDSDENEYAAYVEAQPAQYHNELREQNMVTAYWLARRAGHPAETVSYDVRSAFARGANMGAVFNRLTGLGEHPPAVAHAIGYQRRRHPLPLPECANCQAPYPRSFRPVGQPCAKCGAPLLLYQHDPNFIRTDQRADAAGPGSLPSAPPSWTLD